jgi:hypothetical protein
MRMLSICNMPQWPNQLPHLLCVSPVNSFMPFKRYFTGFSLPCTPLTTTWHTTHTQHAHVPHGQTDHHALTLSPQPPRCRCGSCIKVLPCPSNVVGLRFALPMMLPGHGSGFLHLPRQQCALPTSPYTPTATPQIKRHHKCQNMWRVRTTKVVLALHGSLYL